LFCGLETLLKTPNEMAGFEEEGNVTCILLKQLLAVTVLCGGLAINKNLFSYMFPVTSVCQVHQYMLHCGINISSVP
jgi:hypothetical protein